MARSISSAAGMRPSCGTKIVYARTIAKPAGELFDHVRDFSRLILLFENPLHLRHPSAQRFEATTPKEDWQITGRIISERRPEVIAWQSGEDSDLVHTGTVRFAVAPGDEGTEVTVILEYEPKGGKTIGKLAKHLPHGPQRVIATALRRLKALVEAGEIPTIQGQAVGEPQRSKLKKQKSS